MIEFKKNNCKGFYYKTLLGAYNFIILLLIFSSISCVNEKANDSSDLIIKSETFTSKSVYCQTIVQNDNFVWVGSKDKGLIRLNILTKKLEYFTPYNSDLQSTDILKLTLDNKNNLWILGSLNTISIYSDKKFLKLDLKKINLKNRQIVDVNFDNNNNVFLSIIDEKDVLNPEKIIRYVPEENSLKEIIESKSIVFDTDNTIWTLASPSWLEGGLEKYKPEGNSFFKMEKTFYLDSCERKYGILSKLLLDKQNRKWISTTSKSYMSYVDTTLSGLMVFKDSKYFIFKQKDTKLSKDGIKDMVLDKNNNLWIIESDYSTNRVVKFNGKDWRFFNQKEMNLPNSKRITCLFASKNTGIWVGTIDGGIAQYHNNKWVSYSLGNSEITSNDINCINLFNNNILIGGQKGITECSNVNNQVKFNEIDTNHKFSNKIRPLTIFRDSDNFIWLGLQNNLFSSYSQAGVMEHNGNEWIYHFRYPEINSITQTKDKSMYMGGYNAFYRYSENNKILDTIDLKIKKKYFINSIAADLKDNLWISLNLIESMQNYIYVFDGKTVNKKYDSLKSEFKANQVNSIFIDNENTKWFATDTGLVKYNEKWEKFTLENSNIPSNKINCITMDKSKNIWIGTDNGISTLKNGHFRTFNTSNTNLISNKIKSIFIDKDNNVWVGTMAGGVTKILLKK